MKKKILITLESDDTNGEKPLDLLEFVKRTKNLEASAAISLVLTEWYEWYTMSKDFATKGMLEVFRGRTLSQANQDEDDPAYQVSERERIDAVNRRRLQTGDNGGDK